MSYDIEKIGRGPLEAVSIIPPGPITLVAVGDKERDVLAVGMFNVFSFRPPIVGIAVTASRYSYKLLDESPDFSINIPGRDMIEKVNCCGSKSGKSVDKFKDCGLTAVPGKRIKSPSVGECLMNIECKKMDYFEKGDHIWFFGQVVHSEVAADYDHSKVLLYRDGEFWGVSESLKPE
ncbi:MAG: flavin reductase family protein [Methanomassiliicoccales archaeon]|nr:flavin reductase family protein [Methanomassiliicoccales archaeon]